jgi:hypothetical protein
MNKRISSPLSPTVDATKRDGPDLHQWQTVPVRRFSDNSSPRLAQSIPAYAGSTTKNFKVKGSGNGHGKGGKGDVGELSGPQNKIREHRRKQEEYLRQAAKMWQRGDMKTRGGEIAFYYAEKVGQLAI